MKSRAGDRVEVCSEDEILATLDEGGQLDGMPLMPEMLPYCGQQFILDERAHRTCGTVFPIRSRRIANSVRVVRRCNGRAGYGAERMFCPRQVRMHWREIWFEKVGDGSDPDEPNVSNWTDH